MGAVLQMFALRESGVALGAEACNALGASGAVIHSRIVYEVFRSRATTITLIIVISIIIE